MTLHRTLWLLALSASVAACDIENAGTDDLGVGGSGGSDSPAPQGGDSVGGQGGAGPSGGVSVAGAGGQGGGDGGLAGGGAEPPACARMADPDACTAAGCYWWSTDARCHEAAPANLCDQPDPATCEAAGCEWSPGGCAPVMAEGCEDLREVACSARPECHWLGDRCELDPADLPCDRLDANQCALRGECALDPDTGACGLRPDGDCGALDEAACSQRGDCRPSYGQGADCDCAPPCNDPANPDDPNCGGGEACACPDVFTGCVPARADCANTPIDACAQTPGCHVEGNNGECPPCDCGPNAPDCDCPPCAGGAACVPDAAPDPCSGFDPLTCPLDARCHLEEEEICDDGGGAPDPNGDPIPGGEVPIACVLSQICVRNADPCLDLPLDACRDSGVCVVQIAQTCSCDGAAANGGGANGGNAGDPANGGAPAEEAPPPDGDARIAPPEPAGCLCQATELCVSNGRPAVCEEIDNAADCAAANCLSDIRWDIPECADMCAGGGRPACDPNDPDCAAFVAPECPDECTLCFSGEPQPPPPPPPPPANDPCVALDANTCEANGCFLWESVGECPPCNPDGECFPCDPIAALQCVGIETHCALQPEDTCGREGFCALERVEICAEEPCGPNEPCPEPVCEAVLACVPAAAGVEPNGEPNP